MQYVHPSSELARWRRTGAFLARFTGAEMVMVLARTDPTVAAAVLPKPLQAPKDPVVSAFVAHYPETNFGVDYYEGALFVGAEYRGERGLYCLAMPVDDDLAMVLGASMGVSRISMRRLRARPAGVLLLAMGWYSPWPVATRCR